MAARISQEMKNAQELLRTGITAYKAAQISGISQGAISKSKLCQEIISEQKKIKQLSNTA